MWFQDSSWKKTREKMLKVLNQLPDIQGRPLVVALSGGADSVFLLAALASLEKKYQYVLLPAYVHHHCQQENDLFEQVAGKAARELGKEVRVLHAKPVPKGKNAEEWFREERYRLLENYRKKTSSTYIAAAHHEDDQAETILASIIRGCGLRGLKGMLPVSGKVIRPLIYCSRKEIEALMNTTRLPYYQDRMNFQQDYLRSRIRQQLIPLLRKDYSPQITRHLVQLGKIMGEYSRKNDAEREGILKKIDLKQGKNKASFNFAGWKKLDAFNQKDILHYLLGREASYDLISKLHSSLLKGKNFKRGKVKASKKKRVTISF